MRLAVRLRKNSQRFALLLLFLGSGGTLARAADTPQRTPILLELFTSEGCSSCPPVDQWVEQLDASQPIPGAQLIVLSEHVDYWDHDGWKDPFSSARMTERQEGYQQELGLREVYTPQVIVDGTIEIHPTNVTQMREDFARAATTAMTPMQIGSAAVEAGNPAYLTGRITTDGPALQSAGVYVAVAINRTQTDVLAGENDGKKLTNVAVVEDLVRVGKVDRGEAFSQEFRVKLWKGADAGNLRVVAFVQEPSGRVLGAAMTEAIGKE